MALQFLSKRDSVPSSQEGLAPEGLDEAFREKVPALWEFLTVARWDDGTPRETGTLMFFLDEGRWKVCVADRDQGLVGFITLAKLQDAFKKVDEALQKGTVDWRRSRESRSGSRRR